MLVLFPVRQNFRHTHGRLIIQYNPEEPSQPSLLIEDLATVHTDEARVVDKPLSRVGKAIEDHGSSFQGGLCWFVQSKCTRLWIPAQ